MEAHTECLCDRLIPREWARHTNTGNQYFSLVYLEIAVRHQVLAIWRKTACKTRIASDVSGKLVELCHFIPR